jgi:hypothetical protein
MDAVHNKAAIGLSIAGAPGFQFLDLTATPAFEPAFKSPSGAISEDALVDPGRNLLLSPSERNNYEIVNISTSTTPKFFESPITGLNGIADSAGEDCSTGIALTVGEGSNPASVFLADLTQAKFTPGSPSGTWMAPSQVQSLSEANLSETASIAVAQGTHTGIISVEFGGNQVTAIKLPATSGGGVPAITDWVTCSIGEFNIGNDPHTLTAHQSPNGVKDAIGLLADGGATTLAVVDLTKMLNKTIVPRTAGGHACASGSLPGSVVTTVPVP